MKMSPHYNKIAFYEKSAVDVGRNAYGNFCTRQWFYTVKNRRGELFMADIATGRVFPKNLSSAGEIIGGSKHSYHGTPACKQLALEPWFRRWTSELVRPLRLLTVDVSVAIQCRTTFACKLTQCKMRVDAPPPSTDSFDLPWDFYYVFV